jgi:hypothetical protein
MKNIIKLTTDLIGLNGLSTYHSYLDTENTLHIDSISVDFEQGYINFDSDYFWTYFDNITYMNDLCKGIDNWTPNLLDTLNEVGFTSINQIDCKDYSSPKYYNFSGDRFYLDFNVNENFIDECIKIGLDNEESFSTYLRSNFSIWDGFISFTANNLERWLTEVKQGEETAIGALISFILNELNDVQNIYFDVLECLEMYYTEYVDYKPLEDLKNDILNGTFVSGSINGISTDMEFRALSTGLKDEFKTYYNLEPERVNELTCEKYDIEFNFIPYILEAYNEIDSQTLKLF